MAQFSLQVVENRPEAADSRTLRFAKPAGMEYRAGQYMTYMLPVQDPRGPTRQFSLASSPTEDFLQLTTMLSDSPFKQKLAGMEKGDTIKASGPHGQFLLSEGKDHLFIAGGIGITPFRSMIKFITDKKLGQKITLLYSNKTPQEIAFFSELLGWKKLNPNLKFIHTITRPEESTELYVGRTGRIDAELIKKYLNDDSTVYVCGPPAMVDAMLELLKGMNVLDSRIRYESFKGY